MENYQHYQPSGMVLHERAFPHRLIEGVWLWSIFSEEKEIYFNGYLVQTGPDESMIIDPPCAGPEVLDAFATLPLPTRIIITNADHQREAIQFSEHFQIPVWVPEKDAPQMTVGDHTYDDGHTFPGGWQALRMNDQKTPGESALYHAEKQWLVLGDALIGKPFQRLSMLPPGKYRSFSAAAMGLERLQLLPVKILLPGDGDPVFHQADALIADVIREAQASQTL